MPSLLLPIHAEKAFLLCVPDSDNRVCPGCGTVHSLFVIRQKGGEIVHRCAACDRRPLIEVAEL